MKKNVIFIIIILGLAGVLALPRLLGAHGAHALVTIANGESFTISLEKDGVYTYDTDTGSALPFTLVVEDGCIYFAQSKCPDHVCEGFGKLRTEGDQAICVPGGIVVSIEP